MSGGSAEALIGPVLPDYRDGRVRFRSTEDEEWQESLVFAWPRLP